MDEEERIMQRWVVIWYAVTCIVVCLLVFLLCGCVTKYVPIETIRTEYVTNTVHDSVYVDKIERDSVLIVKDGDTITKYRTRYVYQDRWKERIVTDTLLKTDSIRVPYPVEKKVSKWEQVKTGAVGVIVGAIGAVGVIWYIRRRYKRC